jgi:ankyrin repeat protein
MLNLPYDDHLAHDQVVKIKAFSIISITDFGPDGLGRLVKNKQHGFFQGSAIRCTPILLAAARCHFDILHLSWSRFHYDYPSLNFWNFLEKENEAEPNGLSQSRRILASHLSTDTRSVNSYASRASTTSAFSLLGFPLPAPEHTRSTLLMWAAATLNLSLIKHLLEAGASALTQDQKGRNAVHYAAAAFADATFRDVRECVKLLLAADQALLPTLLCIQAGHRPLPPGAPISPLNLVVRENHAALDPRTCYIWGHDIHQTFISSFLDPLPTEELKARLARVALPDALSHDMCPAASIELLCKHAVGTCHDLDPLLTSRCMNVSLRNALSISAAEPVISILLDHGADPNAAVPERPLITAMTQKASAVIVTKLLDHGADPYIDSRGDSRMSPHEYARRTNRQDLILLFEQKACKLSPPKLTPTDSAHLTTTDSPKIVPRESQSQGMPTTTKVLNKVDELDELDELDDLDEDPGHELGFCEYPMHTAQDSGGSGRLWFSGITARFRKNSRPK